MNLKSKTRYIIYILFSVILYIVLLFVFNAEKKKELLIAANMSIRELNVQFDSSIKGYEQLANFVFRDNLNKPEILGLVYKAKRSDEKEKEYYRNSLYQKVKPLYEDLRSNYNFRQLHFHLPDGTSFLRVHEPGKYGDNLYSIRESVRIANTEKRYVKGFEEGRMFCGYRFVFPLFYENEHIGSVEISISLMAVKEVLSEIFKNEYQCMVKRSVIEGKVFQEVIDNYIISDISEDFFYNKEIYKKIPVNDSKFSTYLIYKINSKIKDEARIYLKEGKDFSVHMKSSIERKHYWVTFLSLKNFKKESVAYFISYAEEPELFLLHRAFYLNVVLITLFFIFIVGFMFYIIKAEIKLEKMAETDKLTGVYNRHKFDELSELELQRAIRYNESFSLIMFDIDSFKKVNDTYGHNRGDYVLKEISNLVRNNIRKVDYFIRWGGEEFLILLPETNVSNAVQIAEKMRSSIENHNFGEIGQVTISFGVTEFNSKIKNIDDLIKLADDALYEAKRSGKNRVEFKVCE